MGIPILLSLLHINSLFNRSKALTKSTNIRYNGLFHSEDCSIIILRVFMRSVQDLFGLKPYCDFLSMVSIASLVLFKITLVKILLGTDNKVMPLQLSQLLRSPFFGILMIIPLPHSLGIFSFNHIS